MERRTFIAATGTALVSIAMSGVAVATARTASLYPSDLTIGDDSQGLTLVVEDPDDVGQLGVHIDVTPPASEAAVDLSGLSVDEERAEFPEVTLADANVVEDSRTTVVLTFDVPGDVDAFRGSVVLDGLNTDDAEHAADLRYPIGLAAPDEEPAFAFESNTFDVEDPTRREPEIAVRAGRLELGSTEQSLTFRAGDLPVGAAEIVVDVNVSELSTVTNVATDGLAVSDTTVHDGTLNSATVLDREDATVVRFVVAPSDTDTFQLNATLVGLDATGVEPTEDVTYYARVAVDDRPAGAPEPTGDVTTAVFDVVDPEAIEEGTPREPSEPLPADSPAATENPFSGGGDGATDSTGGNTDSPITTAESVPGFGVLAGLVALGSVVAARLRRGG